MSNINKIHLMTGPGNYLKQPKKSPQTPDQGLLPYCALIGLWRPCGLSVGVRGQEGRLISLH